VLSDFYQQEGRDVDTVYLTGGTSSLPGLREYFSEILKKKVEKRVRKMFQAGLLKEIKKLKKMGISEKRLKEFGFEYDNPTEEKVISETIKYAKRQMTWFKRDSEIKWFDASSKNFKKI